MANKVTVFENVEIARETGACLWRQSRMTLSEIKKIIRKDNEENPYAAYWIYATQDGYDLSIRVKA